MNKRGVITDAALYTIMMFVIAIVLIIIYVAYDSIDTALSNNDQIPQADKDRFSEGADQFQSTWDYVFLMIFLGVVVGILVISYLLATQPVYFFLFMFVTVILGALAGYLANAFDTIILDPVLGASALGFPIMSFVMTNYLLFVVVMVMLMLITFYARPNDSGGGF